MTDTAQSSSHVGNGGAEQAQDKAKEVAAQAQDKAREAAGQARGRVRDQLDQRSTQAGDQVSSSAGDARSVAEELRRQGKETPARYVEQAADRAERLGGYLRETDGERLLNDVEDFARRNTWAVVLGGAVVGFAASRLLKASSANRYGRSLEGSGSPSPEGHDGRSLESQGGPSLPPVQPASGAEASERSTRETAPR
jgi:hypothetical protein